jgi:hypothetical protein
MSLDLETWRTALCADRRLGQTAKAVADVLARNADGGICRMSADKIAFEAAIISGTREALDRLERFGWVEVDRPADPRRQGRTSLSYRPVMPPWPSSAPRP